MGACCHHLPLFPENLLHLPDNVIIADARGMPLLNPFFSLFFLGSS